MSRRAWFGIGAAVLVVGLAGGGYALLLTSANEAVERSIAQFRDGLPPGASFGHGSYEVDLLERAVAMQAPVLDFEGAGGFGELRAARARITGLEPEAEQTRAARVVFEEVRLTDAADPDLALTGERIVVDDLLVTGQPADAVAAVLATQIGSLRIDGLAFATADAELSVRETVAQDVVGGRVGELRHSDLALAVTGPDGGRMTLGSFALSGLDTTELLTLDPARANEMDQDAVVALAGRILGGLGGFAAENLRIEADSLSGAIELAALRFSDPVVYDRHLVGGRSELVDLSLPLEPEIRAEVERRLPGLPLSERLVVSAEGRQSYDAEADRFALDQSIRLHDLAAAQLALDLGNVDPPPHAGLSEADMQVLLLGATLAGAEVALTDLGLLRPALAAYGAQRGMTEAEARRWILGEVARGLRMMRFGPRSDELLSALETFLEDSGELRVSLTPAEHVPLLMLGVVDEPSAAIDLLNPRFAATPN